MQMASAYCSNRISLLFGALALAGVVLLRLALGVGTQGDWSAFVTYAPAVATLGVLLFVVFVLAPELHAAAGNNPWEKGVKNLCLLFLGPVGRGLSIVAVIIGGLMFAFGEGGSKSAIAGLIFGAGMVLASVQFLNWLNFGGGTVGKCA